jgi:hypothetical protein
VLRLVREHQRPDVIELAHRLLGVERRVLPKAECELRTSEPGAATRLFEPRARRRRNALRFAESADGALGVTGEERAFGDEAREEPRTGRRERQPTLVRLGEQRFGMRGERVRAGE